jgi:DNA-binding response OmpR family regulator
MRVFASVLAFGLLFNAGGAYAQAPAAPGQTPAPAPPAAELKPRFQDGLKYAYVNVQTLAAMSAEGKVAAEKIKALQEQKSRELQEGSPCAVLILTGRTDITDRVLGLELGADDYIVKPFEPRELVARVRSILRRYLRAAALDPAAESDASAIACFGNWRFDTGRHALARPDGEEVSLSAAEAALLLTLLRRPNKILSREQLLGERDVDPFDRSIDVRISRLRRKLDDDPQHPKLIKTVYGAGYLFSTAVRWE